MRIFGKKPDTFPPEEPQVKRKIMRGAHGRFVSKKLKTPSIKLITLQAPLVSKKEPIVVTFYGREIRKIHDSGKWYFAIEDIMASAAPNVSGGKITKKSSFKKLQKSLSKTIDNIVYSDAEGCIKLIHEVEGIFPGPLPDWLRESSAIPFAPTPPAEIKITDPKERPASSNPSDRIP